VVASRRVVAAIGLGAAVIVLAGGGLSTLTGRSARLNGGPAGSARPTRADNHEPPGMTAQINTGPMSNIPSAFSVFSPATPSSEGDWSGNVTLVSGGTGLRITYPPTLTGGNSPARFGVRISSPGTGWYYQRMKVRFSPNWTLSGNVALKFCEPQTKTHGSGQGPNENHVIGAHDFASQSTHAFLYVLLQGPNGHFRNLYEQARYSAAANLNDGRWHLIEVLFAPESTPGAGNGAYTGWVDGRQIAHYTDVLWLAPGNEPGWPYLLFDPTYGGGRHSPAQSMYWDLDELYVSTR